MVNYIKIFKNIKYNEYAIVYHTNIDKIIKKWYWYDDISDIIEEFNCVMITAIQTPADIDYKEAENFMKEFCDLMTIGNKVILFDMEELLNTHDIDHVCNVENLLCRSNFINIPVNSIEVYDTYVYINNNGTDLLNMVDVAHGVYYD